MGWLDDLAKHRSSDQRDQRKAHAREKKAKLAEVERVRKMVKTTLKEVGRAYWGSVGKRWSFGIFSSSDRWRVSTSSGGLHPTDSYWEVSSCGSSDRGWRFCVVNARETIYTTDTSEAELHRAMQIAVKNGPYYDANR